ncbi:tetratricopeptide repeat protein [Haloferula sargassicola]|uniref:Uncharacterized protein n=1 Tax=Haloferula sargassicola TaxID=490096 RepID=A0ABP9UTT4_9BACT
MSLHLRDRWVNTHPLLRILLVLGLLSALALPFARPATAAFKHWNAHRQLDKAETALTEQRYSDARLLAILALQNDPEVPHAASVLLTSARKLNDPIAMQAAFSVLAHPDSTESEKLQAWNTLSEIAPTTLVTSVLLNDFGDRKADPAWLLPVLERLLRDRMPGEVLGFVGNELDSIKDPALLAVCLRAKLALGPPTSDEVNQDLLHYLRRQPSHAHEVLPLLDDIPFESLDPALDVAFRSTVGNPTALVAADQLRFATANMSVAFQTEQDTRVASLIRRFGNSEPDALARWLLHLGRLEEAGRVIDSLPADSLEAFELRRLELEQQNRAEDLLQLLENPPDDADLSLVLADRAWVLKRLQRPDEAEKVAKEALDATGRQPRADAEVRLALHAESRQLGILAMDAWVAAIRQEVAPLPPSSRLMTYLDPLSRAGREDDAFALLERYRGLEPGNPVVEFFYQYLACLRGVSGPEDLRKAAEGVPAGMKDTLAVQCSLALADLLQGDSDSALSHTDSYQGDWIQAPAAFRAVRGLSLLPSHPQQGDKILMSLPWESLLSSERKVLQSLQKQLAKTSP